MHIDLDALGGVAGDMFAAALLHAFPEHAEEVRRSVLAVLPACETALTPHKSHELSGMRFAVGAVERRHHTRWGEIRDLLGQASLTPERIAHALGIFTLLARAEAEVHGIAEEDVTFHEVGAADSIADIVAAATLIDLLQVERWSVSPLPLGSGRVKTAHGSLPVPAPATALLLRGFRTLEDGIVGERVTPTGAAILAYLGCKQEPYRQPRTLVRCGTGLGTKHFPGISNCLRALAFAVDGPAPAHRELAVIAFEVDDQSAEDMSIGLERLRALPGVYDVSQMPVFGKKGRMMAHVQILASPAMLEDVATACFRETTTIGLRHHLVSGMALPRRISTVEVDGHPLRVKLVERPQQGITGKAESDDALAMPGFAARARLRRQAEDLALDGEEP